MSIYPEPDEPPSPEEETAIRSLTQADLRLIDACLLKNTPERWAKVARVVLDTMKEIGDRYPGIPDVFYPRRIKVLADAGTIEVAGNLSRMRFSEVRRS